MEIILFKNHRQVESYQLRLGTILLAFSLKKELRHRETSSIFAAEIFGKSGLTYVELKRKSSI